MRVGPNAMAGALITRGESGYKETDRAKGGPRQRLEGRGLPAATRS